MSNEAENRYLLAVGECEESHHLSVTFLAKHLEVRKSMASSIFTSFRDKGYLIGEDIRHLSLSPLAKEKIRALEARRKKIISLLGRFPLLNRTIVIGLSSYLLFSPFSDELIHIEEDASCIYVP